MGALLFSHAVGSNGVCNSCCNDCQVQVYVEELDNSARGLSWSVEQVSYRIRRSILEDVLHHGPWAFNGLSIEMRRRTEHQTRCVLTQRQPQLA